MDRTNQEIYRALRDITAAASQSSAAVLETLAQSVRELAPSIDSVLLYVADEQELRCVSVSGFRAEAFLGSRIPRSRLDLLPALAAQCKHRVALAQAQGIMPADRWAMAIPIDMDRGDPVAYVSSLRPVGGGEIAAILALHAGAPYRIAAEREADRARATFDALTGLLTPRAFRERLNEEIAAAMHKRAHAIALWFIDTDNFKKVNDLRGHSAGDAVLQRVGAILREHLIEHMDTGARNGGDEFCAIVQTSGKVAAIDRAQKLCLAIREASIGGHIPITASIGVAVFPFDAADSAALLEAADAAMYHSKNSGRDRVSYIVSPSVFENYR